MLSTRAVFAALIVVGVLVWGDSSSDMVSGTRDDLTNSQSGDTELGNGNRAMLESDMQRLPARTLGGGVQDGSLTSAKSDLISNSIVVEQELGEVATIAPQEGSAQVAKDIGARVLPGEGPEQCQGLVKVLSDMQSQQSAASYMLQTCQGQLSTARDDQMKAVNDHSKLEIQLVHCQSAKTEACGGAAPAQASGGDTTDHKGTASQDLPSSGDEGLSAEVTGTTRDVEMTSAWDKGAAAALVPRMKGSMHNLAGRVNTNMNSSYTRPSDGDGLRDEAQIRIQLRADAQVGGWKAGAPGGVRMYPRSNPFTSAQSVVYYVAGDWLRSVDAVTGKVATLLNLPEAAGMKPFSSALKDFRSMWGGQRDSDGKKIAGTFFSGSDETDSSYWMKCVTPSKYMKNLGSGPTPKTRDEYQDGTRRLCANGALPDTASNIMLAGLNYWNQTDNTTRSTLYAMLFEQQYGPVQCGPGQGKSEAGSCFYSWIGDFPSKLLEIDVSVPTEQLKAVIRPLFKGLPPLEKGKFSSAASLAATYVPAAGNVHLFLAFSYPRPFADDTAVRPYHDETEKPDFGKKDAPTGVSDETFTTKDYWSPSGGAKLTCSWPGKKLHKWAYRDVNYLKAYFHNKAEKKPCSSVSDKAKEKSCKAHYKKSVPKPNEETPVPMENYANLMTTTEPPLFLWEFAPLNKHDALELKTWKFARGPLAQEWNSLRDCYKHFSATLSSAFMHAKKWAKVHLQTMKDGRGVLMSYVSLDTEQGCWKERLVQSYASGDNSECKTKWNDVSKHDQTKARKFCTSNNDRVRVESKRPGTVWGCTGAELLAYDGKMLHRSPLAARKFMPNEAEVGGEVWQGLPILDESVETIFYPHSKSTYLLSTSRRGFLQAVPITEPIGEEVSSPPESVLSPVAITSALLKKQTPGTVLGGLEGESPIMSVFGSNIFIMTTFQRIWRFDAMQVVPCGNIMKFFKPAFGAWDVRAGTTEKQSSAVHLKALSADPNSSLVAWKCDLSKKAVHMAPANATLSKNIACCNPAAAAQNAVMACCVQKESSTHNPTAAQQKMIKEALKGL